VLRQWLLRPLDLLAGRVRTGAVLLLPTGGLRFRMFGRMRLPALAVWFWALRGQPLLLAVRPVLWAMRRRLPRMLWSALRSVLWFARRGQP
jgi:hypothetical protein